MGMVIEKGLQGGGDSLGAQRYKLQSLAIIDSMEDGIVKFR